MKIKEDGIENSLVVVFFAGYKDQIKEEREFEWVKSTAKLKVHRIFIQSEMSKWYHNCIDEIVELIPQKAKGRKVLFVGASMGGYAALLFAHLLKGYSLSFSPQTDISNGVDSRWEPLTSLIPPMTKHPEYLNLRKFVKGPQHRIYVGNVLQDIKHVSGIEGATIYKVKHDKHNICGFLKDQGLLVKVLAKNIKEMERCKN